MMILTREISRYIIEIVIIIITKNERGIIEMIKANQDIRNELKDLKIKQWELAEFMGIGETTMTRWLRRELSNSDKDHIISMAHKLAQIKEEQQAEFEYLQEEKHC